MILQTTLSLAAAAAVINAWIFQRVVRLRMTAKVLHGDGGNLALLRRMRAHANFIEHVPITLVLIAAIELSGKGRTWLAIVGALFMLARVAHVIGMDVDKPNIARGAGIMITLTIELGLAVVALLIATGVF